MLPDATAAQTCLHLWRYLEVRQDIDTKDNIAKSAIAQLQLPTSSQDEATILVNAGILTALCSTAHSTLNLAADYHRNTDSKNPQHSRRVGLTFDLIPGSEGTTPYFLGRALLKQNRLKGTTSLDGSLLASLTGNGGHFLPNTYITLGADDRTLVYTPYVGFEVDRELSSSTVTHTFVRLVTRLDLELLFGQRSEPTLELSSENAFRHDFRDQALADARNYGTHALSATFYLARSRRALAGVGLAYVSGTDPTQDLLKASYFEFGLRVRVKHGA
jgi:hypothetical protein